MKENKVHLVPQIVIDCAENIFSPTTNSNSRDTYVMRIEAIRDYCNEMLAKTSKDKHMFLDRDIKSKTNYSRMGKNNV